MKIKALIFTVLVLFLIQAPLTLQEEKKEDTILMNGQEILISGQQMSHENQQAMAKRIDGLWDGITVGLKNQSAQRKEESTLLETIVANQKLILLHLTQLQEDQEIEARKRKIIVHRIAVLKKLMEDVRREAKKEAKKK